MQSTLHSLLINRVHPAQIRKVWARHAEYALYDGEFVAAKRYITEITRHCSAYSDVTTQWHCSLLQGWMLFLEGQPKEVSVLVDGCLH